MKTQCSQNPLLIHMWPIFDFFVTIWTALTPSIANRNYWFHFGIPVDCDDIISDIFDVFSFCHSLILFCCTVLFIRLNKIMFVVLVLIVDQYWRVAAVDISSYGFRAMVCWWVFPPGPGDLMSVCIVFVKKRLFARVWWWEHGENAYPKNLGLKLNLTSMRTYNLMSFVWYETISSAAIWYLR